MKPADNLRRWTIHIRNLSDIPVSRNWYKTVSNLYLIRIVCITSPELVTWFLSVSRDNSPFNLISCDLQYKAAHVRLGLPSENEISEKIVYRIHFFYVYSSLQLWTCFCSALPKSSNISFKKLYARQNTKFTHQIILFLEFYVVILTYI